MIIKNIKLNNIRSYLSESIEFPEGSTLLSGDVGAGKSSILLAMDFALFGLQKGNITGNSLLRSGERKGNIELELDIDGENVLIKRSLKKEGDRIIQDTGELIINNERKQLTATELKLKILELLNYPKELLTKSKSLIYRYTVYTPQEEMKHILLANRDSRLDILRKIFGIDKYKRIKDNSKIFISHIKENKKEFQGIFSDLIEKQGLKEEKEKQVSWLDKKLNEVLPDLKDVNEMISVKKESLEKIEREIKEFQNLKEEFHRINLNIENSLKQKEKSIQEINYLREEISSFEKKEFSVDIDNKIRANENFVELMEKQLSKLNSDLNLFNYNKTKSQELKDKILELEKCPTCKQEVRLEHKENIRNEEDTKISNCNKEIISISELKQKKENELTNMKLELNKLRNEKQDYEIYLIKQKSILEKENKIESLSKENKTLEANTNSLQDKKQELELKIISSDLEKNYEILKQDIENLSQRQKDIEIKKASFENELNLFKRNVLELENEIGNKLKAKEKFLKYSKLQTWLEEDFFNLMNNMEKQIMFKVYTDFNDLFQRWFGILMNIDIISVRLDEEFTPVIEQNGYDIDYEHISGGERTSVALSYRLALNQVINNLITNIKTKDILILDEPTDGFSSEQLDRVREVLDELNLKQIIIVSHDPKVESFVDNVIRVNKEEHISGIK